MTPEALRREIERLAPEATPDRDRALPVVGALLDALENGTLRAAEPVEGTWRTRAWVKQGILLAFRIGVDVSGPDCGPFRFRDRDVLPARDACGGGRGVRIVPGGTTVRRGAFVGEGVVIMPPAYVNVGAWVGPGTMVDSHALVGSCAQVGARVHLSAGVQVGGVLEPAGANPVIIEEDVLVGGGCGIYEGARVSRRAVLAPGVVLSRSVPLYDLVRGEVIRAGEGGDLVVPPDAVVVPGVRPAAGEHARRMGVGLQAPVIVKYRDDSTAAAAALEEALR